MQNKICNFPKFQTQEHEHPCLDLSVYLGGMGSQGGGYFHIRRSGGLGPGIEFGGKIWGKVQSSSPNKRKNLGSSVTTRRKNWERITILGTFGVISEIQRAKFGVSVTFIFGGKIWGSDMNFRGKIWGQASPTSLYGSTPSGNGFLI